MSTNSTNPYQTPTTRPAHASPVVATINKDTKSNDQKWIARASVFTWGYPILFVVSLYFTWLLAWFCLGHAPRPSLDDPKDIPAIQIPYIFTGLMMMGFPTAFFLGIFVEFFKKRRAWFYKILSISIYVVLWAIVILTMRMDHFRIVEWYFD